MQVKESLDPDEPDPVDQDLGFEDDVSSESDSDVERKSKSEEMRGEKK
jgi:hypothetical protein